ncbi:HNH endonuclease [Mesorhizobium sp.]|uniref:HNH endonuclease n=1 Tax=Mesorhizobium sp. TaxID=1871066 RepID=UPI0025FDE554|nr:HNH endonuclease [Mesorhizobium sp.]
MHEFDRPFFKRLANNDTGAAKGHQGGIVIPKSLDGFFPTLPTPSVGNPAPDIRLNAVLFVENEQVGIVNTRYQYQSWGGKRLERRLTDNLSAVRGVAAADDFLVMERSLSDPLFYRLRLHRGGSKEHARLASKVGMERSGPLEVGDPPVSEKSVAQSDEEQEARESVPFKLFDDDAHFHETRVKRIARAKAFSGRVLPLYDYRCAVCGKGHADEDAWEVEAAHIVPRGLKGMDDARNGLALCRSHHWAFDRGLFGIGPDRKVILHPHAAAEVRNAHLLPFSGLAISEPLKPALRPHDDTLAWHLKHVVGL